jgi:hypothetical protein
VLSQRSIRLQELACRHFVGPCPPVTRFLPWVSVVHRGHAAGRDRAIPFLLAVVRGLGLAELDPTVRPDHEIVQRMTELAAAPSGLVALTLVGAVG